MGPVPSTHSPISGQLHRCFLLPSNLIVFALQREYEGDPFLDLYIDVSHLSTLQEIILLGDFDAHTKCLQVPFHDKYEDVLCLRELQLESIGLHRNLEKYGSIGGFGRHVLQLGESHGSLDPK